MLKLTNSLSCNKHVNRFYRLTYYHIYLQIYNCYTVSQTKMSVIRRETSHEKGHFLRFCFHFKCPCFMTGKNEISVINYKL